MYEAILKVLPLSPGIWCRLLDANPSTVRQWSKRRAVPERRRAEIVGALRRLAGEIEALAGDVERG